MTPPHFIAALAVCCLAMAPTQARLVAQPSTEELAGLADVVCIAEVLTVTPTGRTGRKSLGQHEVPTLEYSAQLRVLDTEKGAPAQTIEFRFFNVKLYDGLKMDSPADISLRPGGKYRFYLYRGKDAPYYLNVLEGRYDDMPAVQRIPAARP